MQNCLSSQLRSNTNSILVSLITTHPLTYTFLRHSYKKEIFQALTHTPTLAHNHTSTYLQPSPPHTNFLKHLRMYLNEQLVRLLTKLTYVLFCTHSFTLALTLNTLRKTCKQAYTCALSHRHITAGSHIYMFKATNSSICSSTYTLTYTVIYTLTDGLFHAQTYAHTLTHTVHTLIHHLTLKYIETSIQTFTNSYEQT